MSIGRKQYPFDLIEPKWQAIWDRQQTFRAWNPDETVPAEHPFAKRHQELPPKYYILDMFPYPSGAGLHVGHPEGYTATDILARYRRALGYNVLHPMGWDAFGLPAEQYAVKTGQHPRKTTEQNIATFKRQIKSLGFSYDWTREVDTTDPKYFKWSQWIFLQLYNSWFNPATNKAEPIAALPYPPELKTEDEKRAHRDNKRLAYVSEAPVNWCPELGTVLANEEVIDGKSEVGGFPVIRKPMRQWMLRITAYAERLLNDLEGIEWSHSLKEMQRNWIGRSEGAEVNFQVAGSKSQIRVFTTRPDTLFGATYMVLAPEHALIDLWLKDSVVPSQWPAAAAPEWTSGAGNPTEAIRAYRAAAASKSDLERTELAKDKTGVFTGVYAVNPVNGKQIPVWIADYVLASYGTGAIMAVPGHDTRDFEFAEKFNLPVIQVVQPPDPKTAWRGFVDDGIAANSANEELSLDGLPTPEAKRKITAWLEQKGLGKKTINYKLRDWLFSRQRYWGEPFPIVWKNGHHEAVPESALPVLPPQLDDYKPTAEGQPPLARATDWVNLPDGSTRETNTMPQWAGSCWYYLRYLDARNDRSFCDPTAEHYWMGTEANPNAKPTPGVDLYVGGTEHAVLHLLYARFWHKVLFDLGCVSTSEPFFKLVNQGLILGELEFNAFHKEDGTLVSANEVDVDNSGSALAGSLKSTGEKVLARRVSEHEVTHKAGNYYLQTNPDIRVDARSFKMSKSRGNVVNPDEVIHNFGADSLRLYEMFMGPLEMVKPWSTKGVEGVYRFLRRVWRLFVDEKSETEFEQNQTAAAQKGPELLESVKLSAAIQDVVATPEQLKTLHTAIKKVTEDLDGLRFNTAISALMVFVNDAIGWNVKPVSVMSDFLTLLQPFAPHLAEELFARIKPASPDTPATLAYVPWPKYDPALLVESTIEIPLQVNGKLRDRIVVPADATPQQLESAALASDKVKPFTEGKTIKKIIVLPKKLVNIVVA